MDVLGVMPGNSLPAAAVLRELDDGRGLLIWMSLRAVDLWVATPVSVRLELFGSAAEGARAARVDALRDLEAPLEGALRVMGGLLGHPPPDVLQVARACVAVAEWADAGGWTRTAFEAAARAARVAPGEAEFALVAGRMARRAADYGRAAPWLERVVQLARATGDGDAQARALLEIAQIHMMQGSRDLSEQALHRALRAARRHGVWEVKARAHHDLFCIQCTHGDVRTAAAYALAAAEGYGLHHQRLVALAHDVALFLATRGAGAEVLPLLETLAPRMPNFRFQLLAFSSLGRVAGGAGDRRRFAGAWSAVWEMLDRRISEERAAEALLNLAWGAAQLGDAPRMELAAREALRIAGTRREWIEARAAAEVLRSLERGTIPAAPPSAKGSRDDLHDALAAADLLLRQLLQTPCLRGIGVQTEALAPGVA